MELEARTDELWAGTLGTWILEEITGVLAAWVFDERTEELRIEELETWILEERIGVLEA